MMGLVSQRGFELGLGFVLGLCFRMGIRAVIMFRDVADVVRDGIRVRVLELDWGGLVGRGRVLVRVRVRVGVGVMVRFLFGLDLGLS